MSGADMDTATHETTAFAMQLNPGMAAEYRRRHYAIVPDLVDLLHAAGVADDSIHLYPRSETLLRVLWRRKHHAMDAPPTHPVMRRRWAHRADIIRTHPSNEPVATPLPMPFHRP